MSSLKADNAVLIKGRILGCDDTSSLSVPFYFELTALLDKRLNENDFVLKNLISGNLTPNDQGDISDTLFLSIPADALILTLDIAKPNCANYLRYYANPEEPIFFLEADFCKKDKDCEVSFHAYPEFNRPGIELESLINGELIDYSDSTIHTLWDFGDGTTSEWPYHLYEETGDYKVCLTLSNQTCEASFCNWVSIGKSDSALDDSCSHDLKLWWDPVGENKVYFGIGTDISKNTGLEYFEIEWDFGDGNGSEDVFPVHEYAEPGKYTVKAFITVSANCSYTDEREIYVGDNKCIAEFKASWEAENGSEIYFGLEHFEVDTPEYSNIQVLWDFGDGRQSSELSPYHIYEKPGKYLVLAKIFTEEGCGYEQELEVFVGREGPCVADYQAWWNAADSNLVYFGLESLIGDSIGFENIRVAWDFGDGDKSKELFPVHTYAEPGKYHVKAFITISTHCSYIHELEIYIGNDDCTTEIKAYWEVGEGSKIYFGLEDFWKDTTRYRNIQVLWDFGDGNQFSELFPFHTYEESGKYLAIVKIFMAEECEDKQVLDVYVDSGGPCVADYQVWWNAKGAWQVHFGISSEDNSSYLDLSVSWDFGDGSQSAELFPVHEYEKPGKYDGYLYLLDKSTGCEYTFEFTILIDGGGQEECVAEFEYAFITDRYTVMNAIQKRNPNHRTKYIWEFSDGTMARGRRVRYSFSQPGWNYVCLTVVKPDFCEATYCDSIYANIQPECDADFEYHVEGMDVDMTAYWFEGGSNAKYVKYVWDLGNGDKLVGNQVSYSYKEEGIYQVCLNTFADDNSACFECKEILIRPDTLPEDSVNTADIHGKIEVRPALGVSGVLHLALLNTSMQAVAFTSVVSGQYSFSDVAFGTYTLKVISQESEE